MTTSNEDLDVLFDQAMEYHEAGDEKAAEIFETLAKAGHAGGQYRYGMQFYKDKKYFQALKWLKKAADQDFVDAMEYLGHIYHNGLGVEQNYESAFSWFMMADHLGSGPAAYTIGLYFRQGIGVCKDLVEAMCWFLIAEGRGYETATAAIKDLMEIDKVSNPYQKALNTYLNKDYSKARYLFFALAEKGHSLSQYYVGMCHYLEGKKYEASKWFLKAVEQRNGDAMLMLEKCIAELKTSLAT